MKQYYYAGKERKNPIAAELFHRKKRKERKTGEAHLISCKNIGKRCPDL